MQNATEVVVWEESISNSPQGVSSATVTLARIQSHVHLRLECLIIGLGVRTKRESPPFGFSQQVGESLVTAEAGEQDRISPEGEVGDFLGPDAGNNFRCLPRRAPKFKCARITPGQSVMLSESGLDRRRPKGPRIVCAELVEQLGFLGQQRVFRLSLLRKD